MDKKIYKDTLQQLIDFYNSAFNSNNALWTYSPATKEGWMCPKCGKVWSPMMHSCDCHEVKTTDNTTGE